MPLPNPNTEFVPLDKLTAAQLNQLVANIIALANGTGLNNKSVNGDKLADKSVEPKHTNFPIVCYSNETSGAHHSSGAIIRLRSKIHSNTTDIELQANSSFKIKKSGLLKLSFNIWIHGTANSRPWLNINRHRGSQHVVVADVIDDSSSSYVSLSLSNFIISVQANDIISITCGVGSGSFYVDGNSGRANSQVVLELI